MSGNWVGFQSSPKAQAGLSTRQLRLSFESHAQLAEVLELLTTAAGLSKWLGPTSKCQASVGSKFRSHIDGADAESVFTAVSLPRQVVILNEVLGEIAIQVKKRGQVLEISASLSRATTDQDFASWNTKATAVFALFEAVAIGE
jgi:hypothetical protein